MKRLLASVFPLPWISSDGSKKYLPSASSTFGVTPTWSGATRSSCSRASNKPLSAELVRVLTKYMSDDPETLSSLSLVSRSWRGPAQRSLFRSIRVKAFHDDCAEKLAQMYESGDGSLGELLKNVEELTIEWGPTLGNSSKRRCGNTPGRAHTAANAREPKSRGRGWFRGEPRVDLNSLFLVLERLPSLRKLVLRSCVLEELGGAIPKLAGTHSPVSFPLRKLVLADVRGPRSAFSSLLSRLPVHDALHLIDCTVTSGSDALQSSILHPSLSGLRELVIEVRHRVTQYDATSLFYHTVLSMPSHLETLDIGPLFANGSIMCEGALKLLRERGRGLRHLRLDICREYWEFVAPAAPLEGEKKADFLNQLDLARYCPSLEILHLTLNPFFSPLGPSIVTSGSINAPNGSNKQNLTQFDDAERLVAMAPRTIQKVILAVRDDTPMSTDEQTKRVSRAPDILATMAARMTGGMTGVAGVSRLDVSVSQLDGLERLCVQRARGYETLVPSPELERGYVEPLSERLRIVFNALLPIAKSRSLLQFA